MSDEVDALITMFKGPPGEEQRAARQIRAKKERRTQLTPKQRKRGGVRTTQINYRCSPAYRAAVDRCVTAAGGTTSIADIMEEALALYVEQQGLGEDD